MIRIFNTLTNKKEEFIPVEAGRVRMYVCGPTTYNYFHIGNGRAFLFFDTVRNYLQFKGYEVTYVQNITDIDDKIIKKANEEKISTDKVAAKYIKAFMEDIEAMGIAKATYHPKATEYVEKMIDFIKLLEEKGNAYHNNGDVYFSVRKVKDYGELSGKNIEQLIAGARVEENPNKEYAGDFTLWKKAKEGEPSWDSPWGKGRPGWHTECVVMASDILNKEGVDSVNDKDKVFDIHAGGVDLIFPHHENEIAQAKVALNNKLANYWMHNGFINIEGIKMSKSLGNFLNVRDVLKEFDADAIRYFYLSKHYRSTIDYNKEILEESARAVKSLYRPVKKYLDEVGEMPKSDAVIEEHRKEFCALMDDDFNTARALAFLFDIAKKIGTNEKTRDAEISSLIGLGKVLGFFQDMQSIKSPPISDRADDELIELLIFYRNMFKAEKNWKYADMIRDDLAKIGVILQDTPEGTKWHREQ